MEVLIDPANHSNNPESKRRAQSSFEEILQKNKFKRKKGKNGLRYTMRPLA
jgi:hypothetical protein